jgi:hypothetical protein
MTPDRALHNFVGSRAYIRQMTESGQERSLYAKARARDKVEVGFALQDTLAVKAVPILSSSG